MRFLVSSFAAIQESCYVYVFGYCVVARFVYVFVWYLRKPDSDFHDASDLVVVVVVICSQAALLVFFFTRSLHYIALVSFLDYFHLSLAFLPLYLI